ncbi:MAG: DUF4198 domain-containing protein [Pseudomonadota bacterium]
MKSFSALPLAVLAGTASSVAAHDFWVQPNDYWLRSQVAASMTLQVGHGLYRQRTPIALRRITRFQAVAPDGARIDLRAGLHLGDAASDGEFRLPGSGTYMLVLETDDQAQSHLPAIRFNDYLNVEGLTPALRQRQANGRMAADGSENYGRRAKALVQVGPVGTEPATIVKPVGLTLEIVPERSPYAMPRATTLPVRVFYQGRPLAGALVKLTDLARDAEPVETHRTDVTGRARFALPRHGNWLLNTIWTRSLPPSRETDFETVFSSLSFGFPTAEPVSGSR